MTIARIRYNLNWRYEQKEGFHSADDLSDATLGELLRLLALDDESNRAYVKIWKRADGSALVSKVQLESLRDTLNHGYAWTWITEDPE